MPSGFKKLREPIDRGDHYAIPLGGHKKGFALVDKQDWAGPVVRNWCIVGQRTACAGGWKDGKAVHLHRLILNAPTGEMVDHINGDAMDNRRSNLRLCSAADNSRNRKRHKNKVGKYKGTYFLRDRKKWQAHIRINYKLVWLGRYNTEEDAARAYDTAAKKHFGEFARLNFGGGL